MTITDHYGDDCSDYNSNPYLCGSSDTPDFIASEACCVCGKDSKVICDDHFTSCTIDVTYNNCDPIEYTCLNITGSICRQCDTSVH